MPDDPIPEWFEDHPRWLDQELQAIKAAGFDLHLDDQARAEGRIVLSGKVGAGRRRVPIRLEYPGGFPYFKPDIFGPPHLLGRHQNPYSGELCVWPSGEQEWDWREPAAGARLLQNALDLIRISAANPSSLRDEEERFPDPRNLYYPYHKGTHILIPSTMSGLPNGAYGQVTILGPAPRFPMRGIAKRLRVDAPHSDLIQAPAPWSQLFPGAGEIVGHWVKVPEPPPFFQSEDQFHRSIAEWIAQQHPHTEEVLRWSEKEFGWHGTRVRLLGAIFPDEKRWGGAPEDHWLFVLEWQETDPSQGKVVKTLLYRTEFHDESVRLERSPSLRGLAHANVALFGLGALGSTIAASLARAGVRHFLLLDHDRVELGNLVRHEADIGHLGLFKTDAMAQMLRRINPDVLITIVRGSFGMSRYSHNDLRHALKDFSLVISAFADDAANLVLNDLAGKLRIPQIYCWLGNGAWCGEVLRVIPGETACFECFCYRASDSESVEAQLRPTESSEPLIRPANCTSPTFTGTSFDIATLANAASRMAAQTLLRGTGDGYPDAPYHYANWQFRLADSSSLPSTEFATITPVDRCSTCHGGRW